MIATIFAWLAGSRIGRGLAMAGAVLLLVLGARAKWRSDGARDARDDMEDADHDRAEDIRRRADAARAAGATDRRPVNDRLRATGQLRD